MILSLNGIIAGKGASALMSGLISMYKAESNELDSYGTNNGSPFGGLLYVVGKQGQGFRFNGSNSYVQLPNNAFSIQDFSISLWFNPASFSVERCIFSNANGDGYNVNTGYFLATNSSGFLEFYMYGGTYSNVSTGYRYNALSINTWYNITLTKTQNNQPIMYVNGSVVTPTITNYNGGTINPVYSFGSYTYSTPSIGAFVYNNTSLKGNYGSSTTDEIGIWNRQLTSTEITELYRCGSGIFYPYVSLPTLDSDACAFIGAASITDTTQQSAINQLVLDLKSANIWTKMKAIYPFVGGTASQHRFNLKDPRPVAGAYYLDFAGGVTHSSNGVQFDGATGYANTFLTPSTSLLQNNTHVSYYSRTNSAVDTIDFGVYQGGVSGSALYGLIKAADGKTYFRVNRNATQAESSLNTTSSSVFYMISRIPSYSGESLFINNTKTNFNVPSTVGLATVPIPLGALSNNGTYTGYSNRESAFASIGDGLTDAEATAFYNAVQAYQTTLGRQV